MEKTQDNEMKLNLEELDKVSGGEGENGNGNGNGSGSGSGNGGSTDTTLPGITIKKK